VTRELLFTQEALADLEEIFWYIAGDSSVRARSYIEDIRQSCQKLVSAPLIGVERPGLRAGLRILPLWRRIIVAYELPPDRVDILRVFSGRQDYEALLGSD